MSNAANLSSNHESYGVSARYYDAIYADEWQRDGAFYLELAAGLPGPVLELGCGTGRILLPLARAGHKVAGLDSSRAMLSQLRAKLAAEPREVRERVELFEGDMAELSLPGRFGLITTPFRAFMHVLEPEAQRRCLRAIADRLAPEGRFVYNAFLPNLDYIVLAKQVGRAWQMDHECVDQATGRVLRRYYQLQPDPFRQVHELWFRYEEYDRFGKFLGAEVERMELRWQYRLEAEYLLELCGLQVEAAYGDYDKSPLQSGARELIYVCKRA